MIIAGAKCDSCGRVDNIPYTSDTAVEVMLRQSGWHFNKNDVAICPICYIKQNNNEKKQ